MNAETQDDGTINPSGRFARMEAALDRIEHKLDLKADTARVEALEHVVEAVERTVSDALSGRTMTAQGQEYLRRFTEMERSLAQLERTGSSHAAEALSLARQNESEIEKLQLADSNRHAVAQALEDKADTRYRALLWIVGIATIVNLLVATLSMFLRPALQ